MEGLFRLATAGQPQSRIALEPVYNLLNSLALLDAVDRLPAVNHWVRRTAEALTAQQRRANQVIFGELGAALLVEGTWPDFPAYLDALATQHPHALRDRVLAQRRDVVPPEVAALLADPFQMHDLIVAHLRQLWEEHLAAEWARTQRTLQQHAELLHHSAPGSGMAPAQIRQNLHTFIASATGSVPSVQEIVFVPSPHTGRYITQLQRESTLYLFFDAELHAEALLRDTPIKQVELIGRLAALTEPARLRVLALLGQHNELTLQDLMAQLDTSQPNVSRYLKTLGSYVKERRGKDSRKHYRLLPTQLDVTFQALKQIIFAAATPAVPQEEDQMPSQGLTFYLDEQGAVLFWPAQEPDRRVMLDYLAGQFAPGQEYGEKEVNAVLMRYVPAYIRDHVTVRRDLIDDRLLQRSDDGARYWRRAESTLPAPRTLTDEEAYDRYWGVDRADSTE